MKLSVIIPAYNAETTIGRCMDSLLQQSCIINDGEIIVVNDGSTDRTGHILNEYQQKHPQLFNIITQDNKGLPVARNTGMNAARGGWLFFCDSDDYITNNGLDYVINNFLSDDIDLLTFWSITLDKFALQTFHEPDTVSGKVIYEGRTIERYQQTPAGFVWNHIYKRKSISNIWFRDIAQVEDVAFNMEVYALNLKIRCTNANIYRYTVSEGQITRKRDPASMRKAVNGFLQFFSLAQDYKLQQRLLPASIDKALGNCFRSFTSRCLSAEYTRNEFSEIVSRLRELNVIPLSASIRYKWIYNFILNYTALYPVISMAYRKMFIPYVLPRLSRN